MMKISTKCVMTHVKSSLHMSLTLVQPDLIKINELTASCVISHETRKDYKSMLNIVS